MGLEDLGSRKLMAYSHMTLSRNICRKYEDNTPTYYAEEDPLHVAVGIVNPRVKASPRLKVHGKHVVAGLSHGHITIHDLFRCQIIPINNKNKNLIFSGILEFTKNSFFRGTTAMDSYLHFASGETEA